MMSEESLLCEFPIWGLLPKKETGVVSFLTKYPEYDGRGITIAIFDSGVDPGAPGLQTTSEGKTKVIERFDCSGCGDVVTTTVVQPKDGFITGLTGRKLKIPSTWKNPSNEYRIGVKNAFDLYSKRLKERIQNDHREKNWDNDYKTTLAEVNRQLGKFEAKHLGNANLSELEKLEKDDIEAQIEYLTNADKKYTDLGPVYDCILYHDGDKWMCCVDTSEDGNLENCPHLGEYSITKQYCPLTQSDQLNFSMNVHDDGNLLELVGLCSSHGTHVASIASAYFPDCPEKNGIAPGAQIISLTIGDGRLGSMETGTALVRAMIKVMELQKTSPVQVINMSYGEHAHWSNTGRIGELMNEVVNKYGIVWVASAGNHGPALSTVGTPPDISQETVIGVGAYVSPDMMVAEYSMRQKLPGMPYSWSSRGPTIDGGFGVSVCAPGGAITSVPNFTLRNSQLMNGTSMASPHVAGAVAIVLSGLIQQSLPYSPYSVKRAIENTASVLENVEVFAQGSGLLQIDKTFEYLTKYHDSQETNVRFHVSCGPSNMKGIYLRTKMYQTSHEYSINVEPFFKDSENIDASTKINFNMKLALVCKASYVNHPTHLDLANMARAFAIKIDTSGLTPGVHTTSINAYDVDCITKGPIFKIPITIIQPQEINGPKYVLNYNNVSFQPNTIKRHFYVVPDLATWAVLRLHSNDIDTTRRFVIHCMQILPKQSCKSLEVNRNITITSTSESGLSFQVRGGLVLEVVIAKYWANIGEITIDYSVSFHGIKPNQPNCTVHAADGIHSLEVTNLQGEEIVPCISLKNSVQILKPIEAKINPLTKRDVIPPGRQIYELLLLYNFHITKATEVSPNSALLSDVLYESEFESQLWMLFDSNKQLMGCGDAYPTKYCVKLDKGDYVIRMHIRHDKKEYLDKLIDIPLLLNQKLNNAIVLDVYSSHSQAVIGGKKSFIAHGSSCTTVPLYIAPLSADKFVAKSNNPAQYLTGNITYAKDELGKKVDSYPIKYMLYDNAKKVVKVTDKDKTKLEEYNENLRDLKTLWLSKLDVTAVVESLYDELQQEYPDHYPIYTSYFQNLDAMEPKRQLPMLSNQENNINKDEIKRVLNICTKVIKSIKEESLLAYFAVKTDLRADAVKIRSVMERQKNALIECLCRKGIILCRLYQQSINPDDGNVEENVTLDDISGIWRNLLKFVDPNDGKVTATHVLYFALWHATVYKHYGRFLKYLVKLHEEKPVREIEEKFIEVLELLDWKHLVRQLKRTLPSKYPNSYKPF